MIKFALLGSCCSRDIFRFAPPAVKVVHYHAGSSLISLLSEPVSIREEDVRLVSRFEVRLVVRDFRKKVFADLRRVAADYLLLDLMYEGPDLAKIGASYVTRSGSMEMSGVEAASGLNFGTVLRGSEEARRLWQDACRKTVTILQELYPPERVILHRAVCVPRYREKGKIRYFPLAARQEIEYRNRIIKMCYADFLAAWPGIRTLSLQGHGFVSEASHPWGLAPYHFEADYYRTAAAEIMRCIDWTPAKEVSECSESLS
ncbi:MAG: DUF6270 domain-containing protein [bacterium]|jgi:hypothetical protein